MTGSASLSTSPCLILARVEADKRLSDGFFLDGVAAPDCSCEVVALDCKLVPRGCELVTRDVGVEARDVGVEVRDVGVVASDIALVASDVALVPRELGVQTLNCGELSRSGLRIPGVIVDSSTRVKTKFPSSSLHLPSS